MSKIATALLMIMMCLLKIASNGKDCSYAAADWPYIGQDCTIIFNKTVYKVSKGIYYVHYLKLKTILTKYLLHVASNSNMFTV